MSAFGTPKFLEGFLRGVIFLLKEGTQAGRRQSVLMTFWPPSPLSHLLFRCGLGMSLTMDSSSAIVVAPHSRSARAEGECA